MSDFAMISQAVPQVFTLYNMLLIFGGLILGMVIGCVPGLSVTLGIILMLPLTYTFSDSASAIILLLAVYVGGMYGGSISAITLNTPGTNSAIATTFDGYPLAKKGKVKKALDTSLFASVFGGLFSAVLLMLCASLITKLVANFTSVEYFSLGIMGISLIAGVSGSSLPKSLISGMIGLLMACVGMDAVTGVTRFSFGSATLKYGIDMLPAMIALIALTQVVQKLRDFKVAGGKLDDARKIDKQGINAALAEGARESTLERFKQSKGPDGRRWKTSIRAAQEGGKTLIQSAQLRNSIHAKSDTSGFALGTNVKYAATHQFGESGRTIRARKKKALRFQVGGKWVTKKQVRITIPARPFLGLSEDDMQEMKATVEEFIQKED